MPTVTDHDHNDKYTKSESCKIYREMAMSERSHIDKKVEDAVRRIETTVAEYIAINRKNDEHYRDIDAKLFDKVDTERRINASQTEKLQGIEEKQTVLSKQMWALILVVIGSVIKAAFFGSLLLMPVIAEAGIFSGLVKNDISAIKSEMQNKFDKIETKVSANATATANLKSRIDANVNAIAGVGNKVQNMSAGRDNINNDTGLMWKIIYGLLSTIGTLLAIMFWVIKALFRLNREKKFYKEHALLPVKDEGALMGLREMHDKYVKGDKE